MNHTKDSPTATDAGSVDTGKFRALAYTFALRFAKNEDNGNEALETLIAHIHAWRDQGSKAIPLTLTTWVELVEPIENNWDAGYEAARSYVRMQLASAPASPAAAEVTGGQIEVKVERNRVWIARAHQSFMLAYEADTVEELNWYADQLRTVLSIITPSVKSATPKPSTTPAGQIVFDNPSYADWNKRSGK